MMVKSKDKEQALQQAQKLRRCMSDALTRVLAAELHLDLGEAKELFVAAHRALVAKADEAEAELLGT
jgi:hypothetical protein